MIFNSLFFISFVSAAIVIPRPAGPYGIALIDLQFVDASRPDPYTGTGQRKIPISVITPTGPAADCQSTEQNYFPNATAVYWEQGISNDTGLPTGGTLSQMVLSLCKVSSNSNLKSYPLIFFSPGLGSSRQFYNIIASNIAAQGFTVVTIDVPGQVDFITYLDGQSQSGEFNLTSNEALPSNSELNDGIATRVKDAQFILESLANSTSSNSQQGFQLNTTALAMFGHSFGGAGALAAVQTDKRFIGGANLDGEFFGDELNRTTSSPFLIFASDAPTGANNQSSLPGWGAVWPKLQGPKWQLSMTNSTHTTYSDFPTLADLLGWSKLPGVDLVIGSISPKEALSIQSSVLSTLGSYIFGQKPVTSVLDAAKNFTEVVVVNSTNVG